MSFLWGFKNRKRKTENVNANNDIAKNGIIAQKSTLDLILNADSNNRDRGHNVLMANEFPRILESSFGESLGFRTGLLAELITTDKIGLGPPDLVHMNLYDKFHKEEVGEYFYINGIDVSSESMPIALLKLLKLNQTTNNQETDISTFCSFNIFSKLDIRIRYESDETYQVTALDCLDRKEVKMTSELWEETFVSNCIRSLITNVDLERKLPGLVEYTLRDNLASCERVIHLLCKFLPRSLETGWDTTKSVHPTILHNYLVKALLLFLSVCPKLTDVTLSILRGFIDLDPSNELYYKITIVAVLEQHGERDIELISHLEETIEPLLPLLDTLEPKDNDSFQLVNCISSLLNMQTRFLLKNEDYELALSVAKISTEFCLDAFEPWYYLARCYISLGEYSKALLAINSIPNLPIADKNKKALYNKPILYNYYQRPLGVSEKDTLLINSNEFNNLSNNMKNLTEKELKDLLFGRIVMPNESQRGHISKIWDTVAKELGIIYGPQSANLINFVSPQEARSITNDDLLARNTMAKQFSWCQLQVCDLLMDLVSRIGWNNLLQLRTEVFVMEKEYSPASGSAVTKANNGTIPINVRNKRLCERWLDKLFLDLYEDLKISRNAIENKGTKHSGLEWELLGLTLARTWNWEEAIACLKTSIVARFDPVSCRKLLELYLNQDNFIISKLIDYDTILELVVQNVSYTMRFYDSSQILNLQTLLRLTDSLGIDIVRSKIEALPFIERDIISVMDTLLDWVSQTITE